MINPELIIFTHIGKTGGTAIRKLIYDNYSSHSIFQCYKQDHPSLKPLIKTLVKTLEGEDHQQNLLNNRHPLKVVVGHFGFGLHELLPARSFSYMTMLRQPVERVISYYHHVKRLTEEQDSNELHFKSLRDFVLCSNSKQLNNWQTRFLAGGISLPHRLLSPRLKKLANTVNGECSLQMLELAKRNLRQYYVFGLMENYDQSLRWFSHNFGWKNLENISAKINSHNGDKEQPDQETLQAIIEQNKFDIALYNYAQKLYEKKLHDFSS